MSGFNRRAGRQFESDLKFMAMLRSLQPGQQQTWAYALPGKTIKLTIDVVGTGSSGQKADLVAYDDMASDEFKKWFKEITSDCQ